VSFIHIGHRPFFLNFRSGASTRHWLPWECGMSRPAVERGSIIRESLLRPTRDYYSRLDRPSRIGKPGRSENVRSTMPEGDQRRQETPRR